MLNIVKKVTKKVEHPTSGKTVTRECKVTLPAVAPASDNWIEDAVAICGGNSMLTACVFNFGLYRFIQQNETNQLGKVGEISKSYAKALSGFTGMGLGVEEARAAILANPSLRAKLENETFEQFVTSEITDFEVYQQGTDDKGVLYNRVPDITDVADVKADAAEGDAASE